MIEGDLLTDLLPINEEGTSVNISPEQLGQLIFRASLLAITLHSNLHAKTPDGRHDKTIHAYKPIPYHKALSQSSPLKDVPNTGTETWHGDSINPIPSECSRILFQSYPSPILLSERTSS